MNAIPPISTTHPTPEQWQKIEQLAATLEPDQAIWLSGYFAGLSQSLRSAHINGDAATLVPTLPPENADGAAATRTLTILYGSETGNGADLARQIEARATALGLPAVAGDMGSYKPRKLKDEQDILIVTSTHGEGEPPEPAAGFFEFVLGKKAPKLDGVRFAVLGLGDSTYEFFCGAAKKLDERFAELGATRLSPRVDCDVDYEEPASAWVEEVLADLARQAEAANGSRGVAAAPAGAQRAPAVALSPAAAAHGKRNPFQAPVIDNIVLTGRGSSKETRHIELSLEGSGLAYEPGDALGLVPRNDPRLVETLIGAAGLDASEAIATKSGEAALADALEGHFEISVLTPRFIEHWANLAEAPTLRALLAEEKRGELTGFMRDNHVVDLVRDYPVKGLAARDFTGALRSLQPRLYSIASSAASVPDEVHLTVSAVRYALRNEPRAGVASSFLAERLTDDATLPVYIQSNPHFRLPSNEETPIIMIGAGTGVAPYRAFLQEREARGSEGRSWLFFGERNFRTDFLYQVEWQEYLKDGVLTRMDVAFSRDQAEKVYVHHRLREQARAVYGWLEDGAHVYVCGDATALAPDVHRALTDIIAEEGGLGREKAEEYLRALQRDGRYQRDVY
ncbi:MAG: assimilatory sulfite reductase (NADPH) flavoprotein subunit [Pararhizobium sp.]